MKAIIFNSGLGHRMGDETKTHHKSMTVLKNGETIFHRQIRLLSEEGIKDFIITTGPFEEQLIDESKDFPDLNFTFVRNDIYDKTNYIYSMFLARDYINDDMLFLHGDLVFNRKLAHDMINCEEKSCATVNFTKALPEKDFKGRVQDGKVVEVSINIFDEDCYAFQPFYKLEKAAASAWIGKVVEFIYKGEDKCYAENALNEIFHALNVRAYSYDNYYIDEIDNMDDYARVSQDILAFDEAEEEKKKKRVITYGTFDLLHYGHIALLERAKALGDYLVVVVSTDEFNWNMKQKKCYFNYNERKLMLEALRCVDLVVPESTWEQKVTDVQEYKIDTFVMGNDWEGKFDFLKEYCEVVYLPRTPEISTTQIKNDLNNK